MYLNLTELTLGLTYVAPSGVSIPTQNVTPPGKGVPPGTIKNKDLTQYLNGLTITGVAPNPLIDTTFPIPHQIGTVAVGGDGVSLDLVWQKAGVDTITLTLSDGSSVEVKICMGNTAPYYFRTIPIPPVVT